ncbi:AAA family ATPase [Sphingomonas sp. PP-CC-3G-468]|uniref:AAA family ATPase n=1 Tax=Sphingomonas sp. PP-CC-3G-468 TaxID=2135656 RepID=UPI00104AC9D0|nr:AAA family ATPase [Sphingomonas sp. PP-CC-3G-468]TCM08314.1 RecA-family ATPase [Sphingomonas sp. PP-CC-3G-468]
MNKTPDAAVWADHYQAGYSTFPLLKHSKRPAISSWAAYQQERPALDQIERWVEDDASRNIGIATGAVSGIVVLDLDSADAAAVAEDYGLPKTVEALTPRGRHLYFRHPAYPVANVAGRDGGQLPRGIDVRGDGGYVVAAGSYYIPTADDRADGKKEGAYRWKEGHSPADIALADMPAWLVKSYDKTSEQTTPASVMLTTALTMPTGNTAYGLAALVEEVDAITQAPKGTRNDQLNRSAFAIAQLVAGGELEEYEARRAMEAAASLAGLSSSEARKTIDSAWRSGAKSPRAATEMDRSFTPDIKPIMQVAVDPLGDMVCAADAFTATPKPREWLVEGWLPTRAVTTLFGDGGLGKSLVALQIAAAVASGKPLWGCQTTKAPVLAFYCEDDADELSRRQQAINASMGLTQADLVQCYYQSRFGLNSLLGSIDRKSGAFQTNDLFDGITAKAKAIGARLVILDNINMVYGSDINDPGAVTRFMAAINKLALDINGVVLLLGHTAKAEGSRFAGTMAWSNASRNRLFLGRPDGSEAARNPDLRRLGRDKSNYAKSGEELDLMWDKGAFVLPSDLSPALGLTNDQARDDRDFLDLLDKATSEKIALSIRKQARNYAPRYMAKDGRYNDGNMERRMITSMGRLLSAGAIVEDATLPWRGSNRGALTGLARAPEGTKPNREQAVLGLLASLSKREA